jgi:DNA-binding GntR family transcriptional regulator
MIENSQGNFLVMTFPTELPRAPARRARPVRQLGRHDVRRSMAERIAAGEFPPGAKLIQAQLAKEYGVSMGLIREALLELQVFGMAATDDNRGIFVREFDAKALLELYDIREAFEGISARQAAERITPEQAAELHGLVDGMCEAMAAGKRDVWPRLDREFHDRITSIAGNTTIRLLTNQYWIFGKFVWVSNDPAHIRKVHEDLIQAIVSGDPLRAEAEAREHVRSGRRMLEQRLASGEVPGRVIDSNDLSGTVNPST